MSSLLPLSVLTEQPLLCLYGDLLGPLNGGLRSGTFAREIWYNIDSLLQA